MSIQQFKCLGESAGNLYMSNNSARSLWVMPAEQFLSFENHRQQAYKDYGVISPHEHFNDHLLGQSYLKNLINFLRTRKSTIETPFKFEKVILTAVLLFKRYYLINSYMEEEPTQSLLCAIYISMKMNEYDEGDIKKFADKCKEKPVFEPKRGHLHFRDEGYTEKELRFLSGFRFQTGVTKLMQPLESLYSLLQEKGEMRSEIKGVLEKIYLDPSLLFMHEGPKIALAVVLSLLEKKSIPAGVLGSRVCQLVEENKEEVQSIVERINGIQEPDLREAHNSGVIHELRKLTKRTKFKKPEVKKSPKFAPRTESLIFDG